MIKFLENRKNFRNQNLSSWLEGWKYWYDAGYVHNGIKEFLREEILKIHSSINKKLIISDVGCGSSWLYDEIRDITDTYYGFDFNNKLIEKLKKDFKEFENCKFITSNFEEDYVSNDIKCDVVVVSLSVIEITDLNTFFNNIKKISREGAIVFVIGLNPIFEFVRNSKSLKELNNNINKARKSNYPVILSKKMYFNFRSNDNILYHRILYSIQTILKSAISSGLSFVDLNDQLNYHSPVNNSPIYFYLKLKN